MRSTALLLPAILLLLSACGEIAGLGGGYAGRAVPSPVEVAGSQRYATVSAGFFHTCALTLDGAALCWGQNETSQLGSESSRMCDGFPCTRTPTPVTGGHSFVRISAGTTHSCALTSGGRAYCWGGGWGPGNQGWLGAGALQHSVAPVAVGEGLQFSQISTHALGTCALTPDGVAYCWGPNLWGEVGDATTEGRMAPTPVAGGLGFRSISVGAQHACALTAQGEAWCWGRNQYGQLGTGDVGYNNVAARTLVPTRVATDLRFSAIAAGGEHTCALAVDGRAYCWGRNENAGQLGDRSLVTHRGRPVAVAEGRVYTSISAGYVATCATDAENRVHCWGSNYFGGLGDGTTTSGGRNYPAPARGGPYASVSAGGSHSCAVAADGRLFCWGDGLYGQVGHR